MASGLKLLEPIQLGFKMSQNRILMAAHSYGYADAVGLPSEAQIAYMAERAKGGVGLMIMGGTAVSSEGVLPTGHTTRNLGEEVIPIYQKLSNEIHKYGTLVFDQLMHTGGQMRAREGIRSLAPSPVHHERTRGTPVELSEYEIRRIVDDFSKAALRAELGGFDGVEIKCDQGFLIHQFLSPFYNKRTDLYGGNLAKRSRFLLEIVEQIRNNVSTNFTIGVRLAGETFNDGDITLPETLKLTKELTKSNHIDFIHVNGATNSTFVGYKIGHGDSSVADANFSAQAKQIKEVTSLPVILASMILHPLQAEHLLQAGVADMIAMTRAHIADPEIINKVEGDRIKDIRPCILINQGCVGNHHLGSPVRCIHNPAAGRELELGIGTLKIAEKKKVVAIVGGGIAGMEVARVAAARGHEVHLFEKEKTLGGQLIIASKLPYRQGFLDIINYLEEQLHTHKVYLHLGKQVDINLMREIASEVNDVVFATGSEPAIPPTFTELDLEHVLSARELLISGNLAEKNVVVVDIDWRQNVLAIAEWLVQRNNRVTVITTGFYVGEGLDIVSLTSYLSRLPDSLALLSFTDIVSFRKNVVTIKNVLTSRLQELTPIDYVVFVSGSKPASAVYQMATREFPHIKMHQVGDCVNPIGIPDAILDATRLGRKL